MALLVVKFFIDVMKQGGEREYLQVEFPALVLLKLTREADRSVPYPEQVVRLVSRRLPRGFLQDLTDEFLRGGNIIVSLQGRMLARPALNVQTSRS